MSQATEKTAVEMRNDVRDQLLDIAFSEENGPGNRPTNDPDDDELRAFLEVVLAEIVQDTAEHLARYKGESWKTAAKGEHYDQVAELFSENNVEDVQVRDNGRFHSAKVTVWLTSSAVEGNPWANHATRKEVSFSEHREHYNGDPAHVIIDVRPF